MTGASAGAACPCSPRHGKGAGCADAGGLRGPGWPFGIWAGLPGPGGGTGGVAVAGLASRHGLRVVPGGQSRKEKVRKSQLVPWPPAELLSPRRKQGEVRGKGCQGRKSPWLRT